MRTNLLMALAAWLMVAPAALAQVQGCPRDECVESETSIVFNPATNQMDAFTTATADYDTSYYYELCVDLAVGRLNGPYLVNATNLVPSGNPYCGNGAAQMEKSASVASTPGRQYYAVGLAKLRIQFEYWVYVQFPTCLPYCGAGNWYDAFGYSGLISTQPSSGDWPSIVYTYPTVVVAVPVTYQEIAMAGSGGTAWSPPVIYSVIPNQWQAGATTTFTISGAGFGYSPDITISGAGIIGYTNSCASPASSPSCDTQIVATVTLGANTPGGSVETITVTANGFNPSGYQPVPVQGQSGQAAAQATTQAFIPPIPEIRLGGLGGPNLANNGSPSCPGNAACVVVGQQIALTAIVPNLPPGITVQSRTWTRPPGVIVAGYAAGKVEGFPGQQSCQSLNEACLTFHWVDQASQRQFTFTYQLSNGVSNTASVTFNVAGPANVSVSAPTGVTTVAADPWPGVSGPWMIFGTQTTTVGIRFTATAASPQGVPGTYSWVQLVRSTKQTYRTSGNGVQYCTDAAFPIDPATNLASTVPALDNQDPYDTGLTTRDNPGSPLNATLGTDLVGEQKNATSFKMFLMWNPDLPNSIRVPLGTIDWQWACDAINTLTPQPAPNGTNWVAACAVPQTPGTANFVPGTTHPEWQRTAEGATGTCRSTPL